MRKTKLFPLLGVLLLTAPLSACASDGEKVTTIRVLNMEDYIYIQEEDGDAIDLVRQFEDYINYTPELKAKYGRVQVVYDTTDTNETLYSEMQTGKALYDLICPSDYMIQKLIASNMIIPLDKSLVPNYFGSEETGYSDSKASAVVKNIFDNIEGKIISTGEEVKLKDYAVGYMWGTLGILFNPDYSVFNARGYEPFEVITDMETWDGLWNEKYNNTISIKDSMRDTYAVGVVHTYLDEIKEAREAYEAVRDDNTSSEAAIEEALLTYKAKFDEIFNRTVDENRNYVNEVEVELEKLLTNVFGLEVDSGKQDIVTGKIGINLAWSGDAVYSMDQGEDWIKSGGDLKELCYSIPEDGSNLWFDAWVMPKLKEGERSQEQYELAHEFLNFLCKTEGFSVNYGDEVVEYGAPVAQNMDYIGYTSFMGGDATLELVRDWYDIRTDEIYQEVEFEDHTSEYYPVYTKNDDGTFADEPLDYVDCMSATHKAALDDKELYYLVEASSEEEEDEYFPVYLLDENDEETDVVKTYGDLLIVDSYFEDPDDYEIINHSVAYNADSGIQRVDLSHIFEGTLEDYAETPEAEIENMYFYTATYYCIDEDGNASTSVGRQFYCQYPDMETLNRCSVMKDYGKNNEYVMQMWERFKSNPLPNWAIVLFIVEVVAILGIALYFLSARILKKSLRKKRKAAENK